MNNPAPILSSLPLQMLIFFNGYYDVIYILGTLFLLIYKRIQLPYPEGNTWDIEFAYMFPFMAIEVIRLYIGSKGNKTERRALMLWFIGLTAPCLGLMVYYIRYQTYV
eukprot:TRINITY_DN9280_c0_g1_i1.p1 TRINITY_DN9280_c0_g1~~TRINITY_DN9280_c0_g1_i1.p1  ORF type:complete len:108 (+),score=17.28 TRINITY_DN9280_c0_g1_i1:152-475(+)